MTWRCGPLLIFTERAIVTCNNASVCVCLHEYVCASYTRWQRKTQAYVCCHGTHNRCDFQANLLCYYGNGNLAEGGRVRDRERWDSKKKREGMGHSTTRVQCSLRSFPITLCLQFTGNHFTYMFHKCDHIHLPSSPLNFLYHEKLDAYN